MLRAGSDWIKLYIGLFINGNNLELGLTNSFVELARDLLNSNLVTCIG